MGASRSLVQKLDALDSKTRDALLYLYDEIASSVRAAPVSREDFTELKETVGRLALAQERTEQRVAALALALEQLDQRVGALALAHEQLAQRVGALAQAQERTEQRVGALAQAQERTEAAVKALAQAQERTEAAVKALAEDQKDLRKQVGGLAMAVGYGIEDRLMPHIKAFALREFGIDVRLVDRRNVLYPDGSYDEVNLFAEGFREGLPIFLVGECKAQPAKKDFDRFQKRIERLQTFLAGEIQPFMVGYQFSPQVESYALKRYPHIQRYKTFTIAMGD